MLSLRTRISITVIALIVVVVTVTLSVAYHEMVEAMYFAIDQIVLRDAEVVRSELAEARQVGADDEQVMAELADALSGPDRLYSPLYRIWVEGQAEDLMASDLASSQRYRALTDVPLLNGGSHGKHHITTIVAGQREYRALALNVAVPGTGRGINAVVAAPCDYALHEMEEFQFFMLILGGIAIVIAGAVAGLLVYGAMRPVGVFAENLGRISYQNLSTSSIDCSSVPGDFRPFAESVSSMLDRLGEAFEQQRRFTADAAHELRSPLAVAKSTIQSTLVLPEQDRDYVAMAKSELEDLRRMESVMEQLLLLARLEASPVPQDLIELQPLLVEAMDLFSGNAHGASLILAEPIPRVLVRGNRDELIRLFRNLIDNAFCHGPADGTIRVSAEAAGKSEVRVVVHDEGGGIPPEAIAHLTERFYRVDSSRTRGTGGTGLGLNIAAEIVRRHRGRIDIESSPSNGTSVTVTLACE